MSKKNTVLLYLDQGVSQTCFQHLFSALRAYFPSSFSIQAVDHRFFLEPGWEEKTALIAFPGGRDLPYHQALKGEGNRSIKAFVEKGGHFLGVCAGGYYGSACIEFDKGGELEVCGSRELSFYPGKAIGPAFGKGMFRYESDQGAFAAQVEWKEKRDFVYFNGGCFFEKVEHYPHIRTLARYTDLPSNPAAAIYCPFGLGGAVLIGVHPEFSPKSSPFFTYLMRSLFALS